MRPCLDAVASAALQPARWRGLHLRQPSSLTLSLEPLNLLSPETTLAINRRQRAIWKIRAGLDGLSRRGRALCCCAVRAAGGQRGGTVPRTPDAIDICRDGPAAHDEYWQASSLLLLTVALNIQKRISACLRASARSL